MCAQIGVAGRVSPHALSRSCHLNFGGCRECCVDDFNLWLGWRTTILGLSVGLRTPLFIRDPFRF